MALLESIPKPFDRTFDHYILLKDLPQGENSDDCPLCTAILSAFRIPIEESIGISLGDGLAALSSDCQHTGFIRSLIDRVQARRHEYGGIEFQIMKERDDQYLILDMLFAYPKTASAPEGPSRYAGGILGDVYHLIERKNVVNHNGYVRKLDPDWVDFQTVSDWLSHCSTHHDTKCDEILSPGTSFFQPDWLIDVVEGCIVKVSDHVNLETPNMRYLALSYTWGGTDNFCTRTDSLRLVQQPGFLFSADTKRAIPATIRNAIALTRRMGERYLWVDSICIIQDDNTALYNQLEQMHRIYASAFLVFIVKDGVDADFGIRGFQGVSDLPRAAKQSIWHLPDGESMATHDVRRDLEASWRDQEYDQRMWTFQEEFFAKRQLVFQHGRVHWRCNCAIWHESMIGYEATRSEGINGWFVNPAGWAKSRVAELVHLGKLVNAFNRRAVKYPADCLRAFLGIQTSLHHLYPGGLVFGHPEFLFDISLLWTSPADSYDRRTEYPLSPASIDLQDYLPSWSWMGWRENVEFLSDGEVTPRTILPGSNLLHGFVQPLAEWYIMPQPGDLEHKRRIDVGWHTYRDEQKRTITRPRACSDGWQLHKNQTSGLKFTLRMLRRPFYMIHHRLGMRRPVYTHKSDPDSSYFYRLPTVSPGSTEPDTHQQWHYLYTRTAAATLEARSVSSELLADVETRVLVNSRQECVGIINGNPLMELYPLDTIDTEHLATSSKLDLIEVNKGWIVPGWYHRASSFQQSWVDISLPLNSQAWRALLKPKRACYFVLWISKRNDGSGVSHRRGAGWVLAAWWEKQKREKIDVILA